MRFAGARLLSWSCRGHAGVMQWSWLVTPWSRLGRAVVIRWSCGGHAVVSKIKGHAKGLYAVVSKIKGHAKGPYVVDSETILPHVVVDGDFLRVFTHLGIQNSNPPNTQKPWFGLVRELILV